MVINGLQ